MRHAGGLRDGRGVRRPSHSRTPWHIPIALALAWASWLNPAPAVGADEITVSSGPTGGKLPVAFQIDCSHVQDAATQHRCGRFIENQALKVFPAYRSITGINMEDTCPSIRYTIYDKENWPHGKGEGGLTLRCAVDYMAQYSLAFRSDSKIGPYDVHELLHVYHSVLGALPNAHILFGPSMTEAAREVGDVEWYAQSLKRMKEGVRTFEETFRRVAERSPASKCYLAQSHIEATLYLENPKNVSLFYRKLARGMARSQADREARFNRMYYVVSGGKDSVKQFLIDHGCPPF